VGQRLYNKEFDTWDYQWAIIKAYNSALTVTPACNMIVNIGFDGDATHTFRQPGDAPTQSHDLSLPARAPAFILRDRKHDDHYARAKFKSPGLIQIFKSHLKSLAS
jgi:hypothetical protein